MIIGLIIMYLFYKSDYGTNFLKKFKKKSIIEEIVENNLPKVDDNMTFETMENLSKRLNKVNKKKKRRKIVQKTGQIIDMIYVSLNFFDQVTKNRNRYKIP